MASKRFEKGSSEYQMFSDLWQLAQQIWIPEDDDAYFEDALRKITEFDEKFNTPYSKHFATALTKTINDFSVIAGFEKGKVCEEPRATA